MSTPSISPLSTSLAAYCCFHFYVWLASGWDGVGAGHSVNQHSCHKCNGRRRTGFGFFHTLPRGEWDMDYIEQGGHIVTFSKISDSTIS
jgi:hypothetical protein